MVVGAEIFYKVDGTLWSLIFIRFSVGPNNFRLKVTGGMYITEESWNVEDIICVVIAFFIVQDLGFIYCGILCYQVPRIGILVNKLIKNFINTYLGMLGVFALTVDTRDRDCLC